MKNKDKYTNQRTPRKQTQTMKNHILTSLCFMAAFTMQAQTIKVYRNGTLTNTYVSNSANEYKVTLEESTESSEESVTPAGNGKLNGHAYVDLGLPSGIKWATCNVGANSPKEKDYYLYKFGLTNDTGGYHNGTNVYSWPSGTVDGFGYFVTYTYYDDDDNEQTEKGQYYPEAELRLKDDAATVNWGKGWRTPSKEDFKELIDYCSFESTQDWPNTTIKVIGPNGNSIFFYFTSRSIRSYSLENYRCLTAYMTRTTGGKWYMYDNDEYVVCGPFNDKCFAVCYKKNESSYELYMPMYEDEGIEKPSAIYFDDCKYDKPVNGQCHMRAPYITDDYAVRPVTY